MREVATERYDRTTDIELADAEHLVARLAAAHAEVGKAFVGGGSTVRDLFIALLCGGHTLLEGAPGLGKTLLAHTMGKVTGLTFSRVQFTSDLMPSDITGAITLVPDGRGGNSIGFQPGPIFAQLVLADEINRATPKTQSALLEAMQEGTVTVAGETHALPRPFLVIATQNPIELDGTYLLPEAQLDRFFFKVNLDYPGPDTLRQVLDVHRVDDVGEPQQVLAADEVLKLQELRANIAVPSQVVERVVRLLHASQPGSVTAPTEWREASQLGISPRGGQMLIRAAQAHAFISGRFHASYEDVEAVLVPTLGHRIRLTYRADARDADATDLLLGLWRHVG